MKRCFFILILSFLCAFCSGCSQAQQVESQAFVLALGVDIAPDGGYLLSARMPRIAGKSSEDGATEGSDYLNVAASGANYEVALDVLSNVTPRSLNLSQLKIIVFSEEVARSEDFRSLAEEISQTERLFSAARVVICRDSAREFVNALEPAFGTRLSKAITATFDHFEALGTVPASSLADLCYRMESFYSDPMTARAQTGMPKKAESELPVSYTGAALFTGGCLVGTLDDLESPIASLITGSANTVSMVSEGKTVRLIQIAPPKVTLDLASDPIRIRLDFSLSIAAKEGAFDHKRITKAFAEEAARTIQYTQNIGSEPFGFGERAAGYFSTIREYTDFDFKTRYKNAKIEIKASLKAMNT